MRGVETPAGLLVHPPSLANSNETSQDCFCPLGLLPVPPPGCGTPLSWCFMFIHWLSPKPVPLLAAQRQEVLRWWGCCVLLGQCPLWMRTALGQFFALAAFSPPSLGNCHWVVYCPGQFWRKPRELKFLAILAIGSKVGFTDPTWNGDICPSAVLERLTSVLIVNQSHFLRVETHVDSGYSDDHQGGLEIFVCIHVYSDNKCGQKLQTIKLCTDENYYIRVWAPTRKSPGLFTCIVLIWLALPLVDGKDSKMLGLQK